MNTLRYTLLSDGSADRALQHVLTWLLREHLAGWAIQPEWADLRRLPQPPRSLPDRIKIGIDLYPCDLLFIHRDAEREPRAVRVTEIRRAVEEVWEHLAVPPVVCVVPVRMQEAWLLFDESALREAAGNPNGQHPLQLPDLADVERLPNPKRTLHDLLRAASDLPARRSRRLNLGALVHRMASLIDDFSPLRQLSAFRELETDFKRTVDAQGWRGAQ